MPPGGTGLQIDQPNNRFVLSFNSASDEFVAVNTALGLAIEDRIM